jgi:AcrR family transcriptional regulator
VAKIEKKRVRLGKEESRELILNESLKVMTKQGWAGLSFQLIAKRCGMSPSNVVYHFQNRESLLMGLLQYISDSNWKMVAEGVKPEFDAYERLLNHFQKNLEWAQVYPERAQVVLQIYNDAQHDREFSKVFQVMIERAQERIREHLLGGKREDLFHFTQSAESLARFLHNLLVGSYIYVAGTRLTSPQQYKDQEWTQILRPLLKMR